jgi:hypothetical protein
MDKKFDYKFDSSTHVFYKYYYGSINVDDICSSWECLIERNLIPENVAGFILDYSLASFNVAASEHAVIPEFYRKHLDVFGNLKIAIITQTPRDIVIPILIEKKDNGYFSKPFYTIQAALKWILI